jgi:hypothetical protein
MDYKFFGHRLKYIIINPVRAWDEIYSDKRPVRYDRINFFFPVIIMIAFASFIGSVIFTSPGLKVIYSLFTGIKYFLLLYIVIYATAIIFREITYALDLGRSFSVSFKMIVYSMTPFFICQIVSSIFESLIFINLLAFYGTYIFWIGAEKVLNPPEHKKMPMLISVLITTAGIYLTTNLFLTMLLDKIYFAIFS